METIGSLWLLWLVLFLIFLVMGMLLWIKNIKKVFTIESPTLADVFDTVFKGAALPFICAICAIGSGILLVIGVVAQFTGG